MAFLILLGLIVINGIFAMSELAVVSANKARLQQLADDDDEGATVAIELADDPNRFLSTVQIGITLVGIFSGAFGGSTLADDVTNLLVSTLSISQTFAEQISVGIIVLGTTYLSLVIGELVPKRIALSNPEVISSRIARPMKLLAKVSTPIVWLLSKSTELVARLLGVQGEDTRFITDFEVISMVREGLESGEFKTEEHDMVKGALELDDKRVREIVTPRTDVTWLDINATEDDIRQILKDTSFSAYIVAQDAIENIVGVVRTKDLLTSVVTNNQIDLPSIIREPFYVPETAIAADILKQFKTTDIHMAIIVDEFGGLKGIVTLNDIVEQIIGDVDMGDVPPIQREDGSWLIDGQYAINDLADMLNDFLLPEEETSDYQTLAGFVLKRLGHVPQPADHFLWSNYKVEVMDMDGQKIDKVLITPSPSD